MALQLFNTLSRTVEAFQPLHPPKVGYYGCGPTVYDRAHVGNLRAYVFDDVLRRTLMHDGYDVTFVMNITDVGHLTSDADEGEDKLESVYNICIKCYECGKITRTPFMATKSAFDTGSWENIKFNCEHCGTENEMYKIGKDTKLFLKKYATSAWDASRKYTQLFIKDLAALNISEPDQWLKATDNIPEQIALIQKLEAKGFTYKTTDGIYYDTSKFPSYGKLARLNVAGQKEGARVETNTEKRNPSDFALWKFSPKEGQRQMEWESPWGVGFPGWHIECSAMSMKALGETFDIHTGGVDHIPVHHTNEIAQSEGATGKPFVQYWVHNEFLLVDNGKMSKSLGNFYTLDTLKERGFSPLAYRYYCLGAHYRSKLNFTWEGMQAAQTALDDLVSRVAAMPNEPKIGCAEYEQKFFEAVDNDLNTPQALAVVWGLLKSDYPDHAKKTSLLKMDEVLGLGLATAKREAVDVPVDVQVLVDERAEARQAKDWEKSDELRRQIEAAGFSVKDTTNGQVIGKL